MGKGEIQSYIGDGLYTVKILFMGRGRIQTRIDNLNIQIDYLTDKIAGMPDGVDKHIAELTKKGLEMQRDYLEYNMPVDPTLPAYCADLTEDLNGEVATIEIPGERQIVMIRPGFDGRAVYVAARDGQLMPAIANSPEQNLVNWMVLPGWQKWKPTYRTAIIIPGSIDYVNSTCDLILDVAYSSQRNLDVNQGRVFIDYMDEEDYEVSPAAVHPGFTDFCTRFPAHPT